MKSIRYLGFTVLLLGAELAQANTHNPTAFVASLKNDPFAGKKVYEQYCVTCHAEHPMIPMGAPRRGVQVDWQVRLDQGAAKMLAHVYTGYGAMPARGGCFECTDSLLRAATRYLLPDKMAKRLFQSNNKT